MRVFICLCFVGAALAYAQDGAEYDEYGNRVHQKRVHSYRPEASYPDNGLAQRRQRRQGGQVAPRRLRPVQETRPKKNRLVRPSEKKEISRRYLNNQETASSDRKYNIFNPKNQRPLRPVEVSRPEDDYYQPARRTPEVRRSDRPSYEPVDYDPVEPFVYDSPPTYESAPKYEAAAEYERVESSKPKRNIQRNAQLKKDVEKFYTEPTQDKIYERSSQAVSEDQLEGESFQPAYQPYSAPRTAYDAGYAPPEQAAIEAAVNAGAAGYPGESYAEPQRLAFQVHGQQGPHSYRFGYDTGTGYNRQFRYEERDNYGVLHGRYGYYDQEGKLQVVNYTADPVKGYHAEGEHVPKPGY